ncbi:MAG: rRNA (cytidine-2'-O-)-methyltransferase, partial [Halobacteria archaeon]|nr:rRNA (cytidine-2'-O-)-methyltransferase [Halobacteria archaeon]
MNEGVLYVVATPIGNLRDITARALDTLKRVARIAAEDTRHSRKLLAHFGIDTPLIALHEHNEREVTETLLKELHSGADLALIS